MHSACCAACSWLPHAHTQAVLTPTSHTAVSNAGGNLLCLSMCTPQVSGQRWCKPLHTSLQSRRMHLQSRAATRCSIASYYYPTLLSTPQRHGYHNCRPFNDPTGRLPLHPLHCHHPLAELPTCDACDDTLWTAMVKGGACGFAGDWSAAASASADALAATEAGSGAGGCGLGVYLRTTSRGLTEFCVQ